jgi:MYXO-CTERM domain-containing protein
MPHRHSFRLVLTASVFLLAFPVGRASAGYERTFEAGSLVIPMDLAYQDRGMLQAYGLVFQLLRQGVTVYWVIDEEKVWHAAPCDTVGDECAWDCAVEGSGVKCDYPTASPDFFVGAMVLWDDAGAMAPGTTIESHGYRGGPFVVDAAEADAAMPIVDAWNDMAAWDASPWARRTVFGVVSVHETTAAFTGNVRKEMVQAPTIAVFSDGNEDIATGYLRAAGIPQSNGAEFPDGRCNAPADCGPGTPNPDMLTVVSIMGDMGTCDAPNTDHQNGALFNADGTPAYCQIMSMHWGVNDRETVECDGGGCPATQAECTGETFTYHGHEVVAEVRRFLSYPTHFFAECQAVNAYENTVPNPAWPWLDDEGRRGHFLTTEGTPPDCPCDAGGGDFECVTAGCDGGTRDCCLPRDVKEKGAGFLIAAQPGSNELQILNPGVPYNQLDGSYDTVGGSEPAYNLSAFLGTEYINDHDVTFITGAMGPGDQDVWMTGFVDGECDIVTYDEFAQPGMCNTGKVSYLGGHRYSTDTPISRSWDSQGTRLFLNALFEADCVTGGLSTVPTVGLTWSGPALVPAGSLPSDVEYTVQYANTGDIPVSAAVLAVTVPAGLEIVGTDPMGAVAGTTITWDVGDLAVGASGASSFTVRFTAAGTYAFEAVLTHAGDGEARVPYAVRVADDRDGDGVPDDEDLDPDDPNVCGDTDADGCDDCTSGTFDPANDCGAAPADDGGCGCRAAPARPLAVPLLLFAALLLFVARRRQRG